MSSIPGPWRPAWSRPESPVSSPVLGWRAPSRDPLRQPRSLRANGLLQGGDDRTADRSLPTSPSRFGVLGRLETPATAGPFLQRPYPDPSRRRLPFPHGLHGLSIRDDKDRVTHFFAVIRDLSPPRELGIKPEEGFERRAATDPLTGALTRFHLCRHLEAELQRLRRYGGEASFLLLALDGLHEPGEGSPDHDGEGLLREVARVVGKSSRAANLLVRWRGACLALLAPETFAEEGGLPAEKLRATLSERLFPHSEPGPISIGVATLHPGDTLNGVIQHVEATVSRASEQGSNGIATL